MSWSRSSAIIRHEFRVFRSDAGGILSLMFMPVVMILFLRPLARLALAEENPGVNGSEFTVPAMATMFAFFLVAMIGFSFLSEREWDTWDRLLASPATNGEILLGKVVPMFCLALVQQTLLFTLGLTVFGLEPRGPVSMLFAVILAMCVCLTSIGMLIATIFKTNQQLNAFANLVTMVLAGVSGAFVPLTLLPAWAQTVAPVSPQYWALRGYRSVILDGEGLSAVLLPIAVLAGVGVFCAVLALLRLRTDESMIKVKAPAPAPAVPA